MIYMIIIKSSEERRRNSFPHSPFSHEVSQMLYYRYTIGCLAVQHFCEICEIRHVSPLSRPLLKS